MLNLEGLTLPVVNSATGTITLSFLVAGIAGVVLLLLLLLTLFRAGVSALLVVVALLAIGIGGMSLWTERERLDERRALEARIIALDAQAVAPDSVLACIDGSVGDAVDAGCERAVFASPEAVAAASSYAAARLSLVADGLKFAARDPEFASALDRSRRALEQDRFGVVANLLTVRNGCSAERCDALVLLRDPTRVRANLKDRIFDGIVARHAAAWSSRLARTGASQTPAGPPPSVGLNFPSAASIPPVSIMNAEPSAAPPGTAAEPAAGPTAGPPQPPRRPVPGARPPTTQARPLPPPPTGTTPPRP